MSRTSNTDLDLTLEGQRSNPSVKAIGQEAILAPEEHQNFLLEERHLPPPLQCPLVVSSHVWALGGVWFGSLTLGGAGY